MSINPHYLQLAAVAAIVLAALAVLLWPRTSAEQARAIAARRADIRRNLMAMSEQIGNSYSVRRDLQPYLDCYAEGFIGRIDAEKIDYETAGARIRGHAEWLMRPDGATATAARIGGVA
jgi:hypothetical protein